MNGDRGLRSRVEVWLYRKLRPLVAERQVRRPPQIEGLAPLPEPTRQPEVLTRHKRLAAAAVLVVAAAAAGGTVVGYGWGHEDAELASPEPAAVGPLPPPEPAPNQIPRDHALPAVAKAPEKFELPPPQPAPWPPPKREKQEN